MIEARRQSLRVLDDCPVLVMSIGVAHDRIEDEQAGETVERAQPPGPPSVFGQDSPDRLQVIAGDGASSTVSYSGRRVLRSSFP